MKLSTESNNKGIGGLVNDVYRCAWGRGAHSDAIQRHWDTGPSHVTLPTRHRGHNPTSGPSHTHILLCRAGVRKILEQRLKEWMLKAVTGSEALGVVIHQHARQQVQGLRGTQVGIGACDEVAPRAFGHGDQPVCHVVGNVDAEPVHVGVEVVRAEDCGDTDELVVVIGPTEEWILPEYQPRHDAPSGEYVQGVVVLAPVHEELRPLPEAGGDTHIVDHVPVVELRQSPVDDAQLAGLGVEHDVVWFDVAVHDAHRVDEVQPFEEFCEVVTDVCECEAGEEAPKVHIGDVLEYEGRSVADGVAADIEELNDVGTA